MRVSIDKTTGKLIEAQGGGRGDADLAVLLQNALRGGFLEENVETKYVTDEEFAVLLQAANPPPVPTTISRFQGRAILLQQGLLAQVKTMMEQADPFVQLAWEETTEWRRDSPTLAAMAQALGMTEEQLDIMFREASEIVA